MNTIGVGLSFSLVLLFGRTLPAQPPREIAPGAFSFDASGRDLPLLDSQGNPIASDDKAIAVHYGKTFVVQCDGVDVCSLAYAWKQGYAGDHPLLQPVSLDLTDPAQAFVEPGFLAIDPQRGRFKFSTGNALPEGQRLRHVKRVVVGGGYAPYDFKVRGPLIYTTNFEETNNVQIIDASDPASPRYLGIGGTLGYPISIEVEGRFAYVASVQEISVFDVSDPLRPRLRRILSHGGQLCLNQARLFSLSQNQNLFIDNLSEPGDPDLREFLKVGPTLRYSVEWPYVFLLQPHDQDEVRLRIIKVREDTGFEEVATLAGFRGKEGRVSRPLYSEGRLYLLDDEGLRIIDARDPSQAKLLVTVESLKPLVAPSGAHQARPIPSLAKLGGLLFACNWESVFRKPVLPFRNILSARGLKPEELFERMEAGGIFAFDVADPSQPKLLGKLDALQEGFSGVRNLHASDGKLYVHYWGVGIAIYDVSRLPDFRFLSFVPLYGECSGGKFIGDRLYATNNSLFVIRAFPAEPAEVLGWLNDPATEFFGGPVVGVPQCPYVFFRGFGPVRLADVSDPRRPVFSQYITLDFAWANWIGDKLYAAKPGRLNFSFLDSIRWAVPDHMQHRASEIGQGLVVYSANLQGPTALCQTSTGVPLTYVTVQGNYAYAYGGDDKKNILYVFDISRPGEAPIVGRWEGFKDSGEMTGQHPLLYRNFFIVMGNGCRGARVIDVSNPRQPSQISVIRHIPAAQAYNSLYAPSAFYARDDVLYIADYWNGLFLFDIKNIRKPRLLKIVKDEEQPWQIASFAESVEGYGRYLYKFCFGFVDIFEIPTASDIPRGVLTVRAKEKMDKR